MHVVIFEVTIKTGKTDEYLDIAADLRDRLKEIDGFLSVERFESLTTPGKLLSLSFWRDEAAILAWRAQSDHQGAQDAGNSVLFQDYRITVASAIRSYQKDDPDHG
jgi:heme-degrading monooxygenase HmoA